MPPQNPGTNPRSIDGETEAQSPALPWPTSLPAKPLHGPGGALLSQEYCSTRGGLKGEPPICWGAGDKVGTLGWTPSECITALGYMHTWVHPNVTCCRVAWDTLGQEDGGGAAGFPPAPGKASWGERGRVPSGCHFPFTLGEGFATLLPPRAA